MAAGGGLLAAGCLGTDAQKSAQCCSRGRFALNPATIRGYKLELKDQVKWAIAAG